MEDPAQATTNLPCIFCLIIDESKTFNKHWNCHISRIVVLLVFMSGKKHYLSYLKSLSKAHWKSFSFDIRDLIRDPGHRLTWLQDLKHFPDFRAMLYFDRNDKGAESKEAQLFYRRFTLFKKGLKQQKYKVF